MKILVALIFILAPFPAQAKPKNLDLKNATDVARKAEDRLANTTNLPPEETARLHKEKAAAVGQIETIANADPKDTETQIDVSKSLASVAEAPKAVPYAERALKLAETSGDPKLLREALLTGSEVYYKTGQYDLARDRAQRILKDNPKDKDALALYMQVKDRGTASVSVTAGHPAGNGSSPGSSTPGGPSPSEQALTPMSAPRHGPGVAMTSAASLEAQKYLALGQSRLELDPKAALKSFDAAVAADPKNASVFAARSRARLKAGDAAGALIDANMALERSSELGEAYAARAQANRAIGQAEKELLADYEKAANLDPGFAQEYQTLKLKLGGVTQAATAGKTGPAPRFIGIHLLGPKLIAGKPLSTWMLIAVVAGGLGCVVALLALKRRRSDEDGSRPG